MTLRSWFISGLVGCVLTTGCTNTIPASPGTEIVNVKDYGATGDGETLDSRSIQKAIDACTQKGGGEVLVPPGDYVCGTILLKDGVRLHLQKGAVILGSRNLDDYDNPDFFVDAVDQERGWCLIGIVDVKDAAIIGEGVIDGRGQREFFTKRRPFLVRCVRSTDIKISGVTLRNPAAWTCHLFQSNRVTIRDLTIYSHANGNNDGIDIDSTRNVLIENCKIDSGDDAVCIKATSPIATENVTVRNCVLTSDWGAFKLGTESMGDFKNIRFTDSVIKDTKGGAMKILSMDGCRLENLTVDNITVENSDMLIFMRLGVRLNKYREPEARTPGHMKDVTISNITADMSPEGRLDASTAIVMLGEKTDDKTHVIENVVIRNVDVTLEGGGNIEDAGEIPERTRNNNYPEYIFFFGKDAKRVFPAYGIYARHISGVTFENVNIVTRTPDTRPCVFLEDAHDVKVDATTNPGNGPFMQTKDTSRIIVPNT